MAVVGVKQVGLLQTGRKAGAARTVRTPCVTSQRRSALRKPLRVEAVSSKPEIAKFADSIGLPTDEGFFGFKPFSEVWCGRLAMMGFVTSIYQEFWTGQGTLAQIGLDTPSAPLLVALVAFFGTATVVGTVRTGYRAVTKDLSIREVARLKNFLGLTKEKDIDAFARDMKRRGDFATPGNNYEAIDAVRAEGTPADKFLGATDQAAADATAREMKTSGDVLTLTKLAEEEQVAAASSAMKSTAPSVSLSAKSDIEEQVFFNTELKYAMDVELRNGRAAMVGFLAAVLVEAATGKGIILQIIMYLKLVGLLGPMSGF